MAAYSGTFIRYLTLFVCSTLFSTSASAASQATPQEVANFWDTIFNGAAPHGVPPLSASRSNGRTVGNATVWDIEFDSYRDPDTDLPVRVGGFFALPTSISAPGPSGTFPGLVSTHSVGGCPTCGSPAEGLATAVYYAEKGYASLSFFLRGYSPSVVTDPQLSMNASNVAMCTNMVDDGQEPFDTLWAGFPVDLYQAGEWMTAQPEVWASNGLSFIGHSLGGYAAVMAGVFSDRYRVIAASAPPTTGSDIQAWMDFGNPISNCVQNLPGDLTTNMSLAVRMVSFTGVYGAINNPELVAKNAAWRLDDSEIFFYGGEQDTAVPPSDVDESYRLADTSNNKALHWSPIGGHGGPESFYRSEAWLAGHYPGLTPSPPMAAVVVSNIDGLTVDFSAQGSTDDAIIIAYDYDFGDGSIRNWGDTTTYTYSTNGTYTVSLTVTDGEGLRDTAQTQVTVSGSAAVQFIINVPDPLIVGEGGNATFTVNLSAPPGGTMNVTIARDSGDSDLDVSSSATLGFSDANWSNPHTVTIAAAQDGDTASGTAVFSVSAPGLPTAYVNAQENDDDAPYNLSVGTVTVAPGEQAQLAVGLSNADSALIRSLSVSLTYDEIALGRPSMAKGAAVPGPAWWSFGATYPALGTQVISGTEIAQPAGAVIDGIIAFETFVVPLGTAPGIYPIVIAASDIDGRSADATANGSVTVLESMDGGSIDDGGFMDDGGPMDGSGAMDDGGPQSDGGIGNNLAQRNPSRRGCHAVPTHSLLFMLVPIVWGMRRRKH